MTIYQSKVAKAVAWGFGATCALESMMRHEGFWRVAFAALAVINIVSTSDEFSQRFDRTDREEA